MRDEFAGFEDSYLAGFGVANGPGFAIVIREGAEASDLDAPAGGEAVRHDIDDSVNSKIDVTAAQLVQLVRHSLDEFGFVHNGDSRLAIRHSSMNVSYEILPLYQHLIIRN